ncbi:hypothetical protein [Akkermansia muciniphila]|uniref:hypothetical protein n=1 Tax=Akkermansia muciniphila TaxID=239935 RepID=UPI001BFF92BC|nr:hypothetical protein [Akkermansia muciniphila]
MKNFLRGAAGFPDPIVKLFPIDRNPHVPQLFQSNAYVFRPAIVTIYPSASNAKKVPHYHAYFNVEHILLFCFQYSLIDGYTPLLLYFGQIPLPPCISIETAFILTDDLAI